MNQCIPHPERNLFAVHKTSKLATTSAVIAISLFSLPFYKLQNHDPQLRHMEIKPFDPHRKEFTCRHETDAAPAIDPEADAWNAEALYLTRPTLWPHEQNWKKARLLWTKAAEKNHWNAMMNLVELLQQTRGEGNFQVMDSTYLATQLTEDAMALGIPSAFAKMGDYHLKGADGIPRNAGRAWAFWAMAADMGNPQALTQIGRSLIATQDNPEEHAWRNKSIGLQMLACAASQSDGEAGFQLGLALAGENNRTPGERHGAILALQNAVRFGSSHAARLLGSFDQETLAARNLVDQERAARYMQFAAVLLHHPDLRFPNIDKVIPLPPARLPAWDGTADSLTTAAQPVRLKYPDEPLALPPRIFVREISRPAHATSPTANAGKACPTTGIWYPQPTADHPEARVIDPYLHQRFIKAGAVMPDATTWGLKTEGKLVWHLLERGA